MKKLVDPVMAAYAKEIGADAIYQKINTNPPFRRGRRGRNFMRRACPRMKK